MWQYWLVFWSIATTFNLVAYNSRLISVFIFQWGPVLKLIAVANPIVCYVCLTIITIATDCLHVPPPRDELISTITGYSTDLCMCAHVMLFMLWSITQLHGTILSSLESLCTIYWCMGVFKNAFIRSEVETKVNWAILCQLVSNSYKE